MISLCLRLVDSAGLRCFCTQRNLLILFQRHQRLTDWPSSFEIWFWLLLITFRFSVLCVLCSELPMLTASLLCSWLGFDWNHHDPLKTSRKAQGSVVLLLQQRFPAFDSPPLDSPRELSANRPRSSGWEPLRRNMPMCLLLCGLELYSFRMDTARRWTMLRRSRSWLVIKQMMSFTEKMRQSAAL